MTKLGWGACCAVTLLMIVSLIILTEFVVTSTNPSRYDKNDIIQLINTNKISDVKINNNIIKFKDEGEECYFYIFYNYDEALKLEKRFGEKYRYNMYRYRNILFYTDNVMLLDKYIRKIRLMED